MQKQKEFLQRVRQAHLELGIPETFMSVCRMPICNEPEELADTELDFYDRPQQLTPQARSSWMRMKQAAGAEGVELFLISAFRSLAYQQQLIARKLAAGQSIEVILKVNAAPGFSEHHTGRAIDIGTPGCSALVEEFENTKAFEWLTQRAGEFKFALSYPRGNVLGIDYEPWHWCFHP